LSRLAKVPVTREMLAESLERVARFRPTPEKLNLVRKSGAAMLPGRPGNKFHVGTKKIPKL
jgi:hypothetical protein